MEGSKAEPAGPAQRTSCHAVVVQENAARLVLPSRLSCAPDGHGDECSEEMGRAALGGGDTKAVLPVSTRRPQQRIP